MPCSSAFCHIPVPLPPYQLNLDDAADRALSLFRLHANPITTSKVCCIEYGHLSPLVSTGNVMLCHLWRPCLWGHPCADAVQLRGTHIKPSCSFVLLWYTRTCNQGPSLRSIMANNSTIPPDAILNPYTPLAFLPPSVADQYQVMAYVYVATLAVTSANSRQQLI
jgi:hypothetical protein